MTPTDHIRTDNTEKKAENMTATIEKSDTEIEKPATEGKDADSAAPVVTHKTKPAKQKSSGPGVIARVRGAISGSMSTRTKVIGIRLATLAVDWLVVLSTVVALLPLLGAWLHQQSGAQNLTMEGAVAFWLVPYLFATGMIMILEFVALRGLWRAGSRKIARLRSTDAGAISITGESETAMGRAVRKTPTTGGRKKNRNRKRRMK